MAIGQTDGAVANSAAEIKDNVSNKITY